MCYNCGCDEPNDDHGKGKITEGGMALTEADLQKIAEEWDMDKKTVKKNIQKLLADQKSDD